LGVKFTIYKLLNFIAVNIFNGKFPGIFSVEHILRKNDLKIISIKDINSKESLDFLERMDIDIVFSIAASQILKKGVLKLPKIGCFNIHTSKLPQNRGMMPNFWSLYNYDKSPISAITIHKMNEALDDGDILLQEEFYLDPKESLDSLIKRTKMMSVKIFLKAVDLLNNKGQNLIKNDSTKATYNSFPTKLDVIRFKEKGLKIR
jgi:methionyl-tRNA formyltransferase